MSLPRYIGKFLRAGPKRALRQQFQADFVKTGTLRGVDLAGNKYYEDLTEEYGRDRWIEPVSWNYDPSEIPAEWNAWIHKFNDIAPSLDDLKRSKWMIAHQANPTGTAGAYKPYDTTTPKITAWEPKIAARS